MRAGSIGRRLRSLRRSITDASRVVDASERYRRCRLPGRSTDVCRRAAQRRRPRFAGAGDSAAGASTVLAAASSDARPRLPLPAAAFVPLAAFDDPAALAASSGKAAAHFSSATRFASVAASAFASAAARAAAAFSSALALAAPWTSASYAGRGSHGTLRWQDVRRSWHKK